ncbi:MAG: ATP-binding cassette domain-containing protein [Gemmobacter sp.]
MLHLDRLTLTQGPFRLTADWQVPAGARVALIGPSGAGKSTLLNAIAGFLSPTSGRILWQGQDLGPLPPGKRPVSILFQDQNLFPHLSITRNLALGLSPARRLSAADASRIDQALARVGLADLGPRMPAALSGGQQSRAALARALLRARPILLLDEPFAALGPAMKSDMLDLVAQIATDTGATVLLVTHDPADARRLCPLTCLVADGTAQPPRPTAALLDHPPPALAAYLGNP